MTLKELYDAHPEWRDLLLFVGDPEGGIPVPADSEHCFVELVGTAKSDTDPTPTLVKVLVLY